MLWQVRLSVKWDKNSLLSKDLMVQKLPKCWASTFRHTAIHTWHHFIRCVCVSVFRSWVKMLCMTCWWTHRCDRCCLPLSAPAQTEHTFTLHWGNKTCFTRKTLQMSLNNCQCQLTDIFPLSASLGQTMLVIRCNDIFCAIRAQFLFFLQW